MKNCCFTGHRIIKTTPELVQRLKAAIVSVIELGVTEFYNSAAIGFDAVSSQIVVDLKKIYSNIKLHLLLPCPPEEQTKGWNKSQIEKYNSILQAADSITVISGHYTRYCMKRRNERLVELSDCCICYCNNRRSGTGQTLKMAENKGIPIINLLLKAVIVDKK